MDESEPQRRKRRHYASRTWLFPSFTRNSSAFFLALVPQFGLFKKNSTLINAAWPLSYIFTLATKFSIGLLAYSFAVDEKRSP